MTIQYKISLFVGRFLAVLLWPIEIVAFSIAYAIGSMVGSVLGGFDQGRCS